MQNYMDSDMNKMAKSATQTQVKAANRYKKEDSVGYEEFRATADMTPNRTIDLTQVR